jgi:hypothetical protein
VRGQQANAGRALPGRLPLVRRITSTAARSPLGADAVAAAAVLAVVVALFGRPVPYGNESLYLLAPYRVAHPEFLQGDWTFAQPVPDQKAFNLLFGAVLKLLPFDVAVWFGRLACWSVLAIGLVRVARALGAAPHIAAAAVTLWIFVGQSTVGGEWVFGGLEAKVVAYCFAVFSIERGLAGRVPAAGVLAGLAVLFHLAAGLQVGLAVAAGAIALGPTRRDLTIAFGAAMLLAAPVVLAVLASAPVPGSAAADEWRLLATTAMPFHFDALNPVYFPRREVLAVGLMALYVLVSAATGRPRAERRFMTAFTGTLIAIFAFGFLARIAGRYELLALTPFRVLPLFGLLFFFILMLRDWSATRLTPRLPLLSALAMLCLMSNVNPVAGMMDGRAAARIASRQDPGLEEAARWLARETDPVSVVILPPWMRNGFYVARRPQVASWEAVRLHDIAEWRRRIEALVGPLPVGEVVGWGDLKRRYFELTEEAVLDIAQRYGARYFVSRPDYGLPVVHRAGDYTVYDLAVPVRPAPVPDVYGACRPGCPESGACPTDSRETDGQSSAQPTSSAARRS